MSQTFATVQPADMRASDNDRDQAIAVLNAGLRSGRLDYDEHSGRVAAALASRTLGQLWTLTADLPREPAPAVALPSAGPVPLGGTRPMAVVPRPPASGSWVPPTSPEEWAYGAPSPVVSVPPVRTNATAVTAFVFSLAALFLCLVVVPGVLAVTLGVRARRELRRRGWVERGEGLAVAAIIIGAGSTALGLAIILAHVLG